MADILIGFAPKRAATPAAPVGGPSQATVAVDRVAEMMSLLRSGFLKRCDFSMEEVTKCLVKQEAFLATAKVLAKHLRGLQKKSVTVSRACTASAKA